MNNPILKAAFFDIDGTLVPYDTRCVSQADCEAIEALREQGTLIFIVTGRHICETYNIPFLIHGAVCSNGALTYVVKDGCAHFSERERFVLIDEHPIPRQQAIDIARMIDDNKIPAFVCTASTALSGNLMQKELEFIHRVNIPSPKVGNILETAIRERIYNFNAFVSPEEEKRLFKDILQELETPRWCNEYCDINVKGLDKVLGIKKILDIYNIGPDDIIAFGDGSNDIGMLEFAGRGIAMGTATDEVKSVADYITSSACDNGVSNWLSSFLNRY